MTRDRVKVVLLVTFFTLLSGPLFESSVRAQNLDSSQEPDREYRLESKITGYTGIGGQITGVRNPVLRAEKGEVVKITIVNGETLAHDLVMEQLGIRTDIIVDEGATSSIIFTADQSDTYFCSIPGHRATMEGQFEVVESMGGGEVAEGVVPRKDGRPLNFNFEMGSLRDWTPEGDAFTDSSVLYDASKLYGEDADLGFNDSYFLSSGGTRRHQQTGTLTSVSFEVTHPYASFLVSGGALEGTRVELVRTDTEEIFFEITGNSHERLRPVVVDLQDQMDEEIYIRLVDEETGEVPEIAYISPNQWAHIAFDDFRFYEERPSFVNEINPEDIVVLPMRDIIKNSGLSGEDAVKEMEVPVGFNVQLAASEPDVVRPIAMAIDDRGRIWIAEAHTYPEKAPEGEGGDRLLIFEDTTGDGKLDSRKIFMEGLNLISGFELGFGGVWVGAAPELLYIPIDESGDKPAGPPEVLLDGWGYQDTHETLNSFRWGPDGWLYGTHGVFTHSNVGEPGAPESERQKINGGVWRYHPTRHEFEVFANGTSNPWGIDFNDYGHSFITACVIPHMFHIVRGARYDRQAGEHFNQYTYNDIQTIADHVHWVGDRGPHAGNYRSGSAGGGHAHAGAMFYMGNDHWGLDRNAIWMNNIHGYRVNTDHIEREGSGYSASHGEDFLKTHDSWSQWLDYRIDSAGSVFAIDWYDKNQCHSPNADVHDKTLGRIYKISHEKDEWVQTDLTEKSSLELVDLQLEENEFYVRHARRLLQERGADDEVHQALGKMFKENPDITRKLRALWALYVTEGVSESDLLELTNHGNEYVRSWAVQLIADDGEINQQALDRFADMAENDPSAMVRLQLASALLQIEPEKRWETVEGLVTWSEDADDHNLPLMLWYAAEPLAELDAERAADLAMSTELPYILSYTIQRIGVIGSDQSREILRQVDQELQNLENPRQSDHEARATINQLLSQAE